MNIFLTSFLYMHQRTSIVSFISTIFYDDNSYHVHIPSIYSLCAVKAFFLFQNFVESFKLILYDFSYITFKQITYYLSLFVKSSHEMNCGGYKHHMEIPDTRNHSSTECVIDENHWERFFWRKINRQCSTSILCHSFDVGILCFCVGNQWNIIRLLLSNQCV